MATTEVIDNADNDGSTFTSAVFEIDNGDHSQVHSWLATVDNGWDVAVDITVQLTTDDDESFTKFITDSAIAESVTVSSGSTDGFGDADNEPFSYIRLEVAPAADPTSGNLTLTWQKRALGGS